MLTNARTFPCTGFLVSNKYLMTNYHCVPGVIESAEAKRAGITRIDAVQIILGYTQDGVFETALGCTNNSTNPPPI